MRSAWSKDGTVAHLDANFSAAGRVLAGSADAYAQSCCASTQGEKSGVYRLWIARTRRGHLGGRYVFRLCGTEACGSAVIGAVLAHAALEKCLWPLFPLGVGDS